MSTYAISDVHGHFSTYRKLLEKLKFSDEDFLYVVGDVIDRGRDGIKIIQDIMSHPNMELILGNHEYMMIEAIDFLRKNENEGKMQKSDLGEAFTPVDLWFHPANGGKTTYNAFLKLEREEQDRILEYMKGLKLIKRVHIGDKDYHISHSYSVGYKFGEELYYNDALIDAESVVWDSLVDDRPPIDMLEHDWFAYPDDTYIVGHVFTQRLGCMDDKGRGMICKIKRRGGIDVVDVDCGMALNSKSSRLGCYCLDTGKEIYVTYK
jgi:serine/threonine protein phosphatase 1